MSFSWSFGLSCVRSLSFEVSSFGSRVSGFGARDPRVSSLRCRVQGAGCRVQGSYRGETVDGIVSEQLRHCRVRPHPARERKIELLVDQTPHKRCTTLPSGSREKGRGGSQGQIPALALEVKVLDTFQIVLSSLGSGPI